MSAVAQDTIHPLRTLVYEEFCRRARLLEFLDRHPDKVESFKDRYRRYPVDFICDWGVTVDPRNAAKGLPTVLPFILDQRQREWVEWTHRNYLAQRYGGTEKSRDVGLSWLIVGYSISLAVLFDGSDIGWGSFKQEKVDKAGVMGSLFEKGRTYAEALPRQFNGGFVLDDYDCSKERYLHFPETRSTIFGEIGDNIGRGNRAAIYFVDETAYLEHDEAVDAALSKTTNCRQDASSVHGMENTFAQRMHKPLATDASPAMGEFVEEGDPNGVNKFTFRWQDNPRMTQADYEKFVSDWGDVIAAQELGINYQASVEGIVIPAKWVEAAVDAHIKLKIKATGMRLGSLDVADQGIDKNALCIRHGAVVVHLEKWSGSGSDIYATTERAFNLCDFHLAKELVYDADGLGAGCRGDGRKLNEERVTDGSRRTPINMIAHQGSAAVFDPRGQMVEGRFNEDFFANYKAQCWWALRQRFDATYRALNGEKISEDRLISLPSELPDLSKLKIELSQPTYSLNKVGQVLIDKQPEGKPSPNLADAVNQAYAPRSRPMKIADSVFEEDWS